MPVRIKNQGTSIDRRVGGYEGAHGGRLLRQVVDKGDGLRQLTTRRIERRVEHRLHVHLNVAAAMRGAETRKLRVRDECSGHRVGAGIARVAREDTLDVVAKRRKIGAEQQEHRAAGNAAV